MPNQFNLVLTGKPLAGRSREAAAAALAKVMRVPEDRALALLSGQEQVVKRNLDEASLARYVAALHGAGVETRTEAVAAAATVAIASPPLRRPLRSEEDLDALLRELDAPQVIGDGVAECPCCRTIALKKRSVGEECPVCGWRDCQGQNEYHPDEAVPGRNRGLSLAQARAEFEAYGSLDPQYYTPNEVPLRRRIVETLATLSVTGYCGYSLWIDSLYIPDIGRYRVGPRESLTLHGVDAWLLTGALLFGVLQFFMPVIDHYDRRRNEIRYRKIAAVFRTLMFVFLGLFAVVHAYRSSRSLAEFMVLAGMLLVVAVAAAVIVRKINNKIN